MRIGLESRDGRSTDLRRDVSLGVAEGLEGAPCTQ